MQKKEVESELSVKESEVKRLRYQIMMLENGSSTRKSQRKSVIANENARKSMANEDNSRQSVEGKE